MHDGGALWQAAQRAAGGATAGAAANRRFPRCAPRREYRIDRSPFVPQHPTPAPAAGPVDLMATVPLAEAHKFRRSRDGRTDSACVLRLRPHDGLRQPQVIQPNPIGDMERDGRRTSAGRRSERSHSGLRRRAAASRHAAEPRDGGAPPILVQPEKAPNFWQAASPVKKATLVLMPFALIMAFLMLRDESAPPPRVATAGAKHALDAGTLAAAGAADGGLASLVRTRRARSPRGARATPGSPRTRPTASKTRSQIRGEPRRKSPRSRAATERPSARRSTASPPGPSTKRPSATTHSRARTPTTQLQRGRPYSPREGGELNHDALAATHPVTRPKGCTLMKSRLLSKIGSAIAVGGVLAAASSTAATSMSACGESGACTNLREATYASLETVARVRSGRPRDQCIIVAGNPKDCTGVLTCEFAINPKFREEAERRSTRSASRARVATSARSPTASPPRFATASR